MTEDPDLRLLIHALADGELDAATALDVERRMAGDPALKAEHDRIVALRNAIDGLPRPEPGEALLRHVEALAAGGDTPARPASLRLSRFDWRAMAASIMATAVVASGATYWAVGGAAPGSDFADAIANDHRRSLLATSPVDVASSDRHTVKPWLDARIGVSPPAVDLAKDGFALVGGRVEVVAGRPLPALVYRHREHLITVVAVPRQPGAAAPDADLSAGGFSLVRWSDAAYSYWAISDMERGELDAFAALFRKATAGG